eukprot:scaffold24515_cov112-Isochrysis_galbana.AAC.6
MFSSVRMSITVGGREHAAAAPQMPLARLPTTESAARERLDSRMPRQLKRSLQAPVGDKAAITMLPQLDELDARS